MLVIQIMGVHQMEHLDSLVVITTWAELKYVKMNGTLVSVVTALQGSMES